MTIIYDIETSTHDGIDASKNRLRIFAYYNTITGESGILRETERDKIKKILLSHDVKVGFNNKAYDDIILRREGYKINGLILDLREIIKKKSPVMSVKFKSYSLKNICNTLGLNLKSDDMNYEWLNDDLLIEVNWIKIKEYTAQDIKITKELWEYINEYFAAFADSELISTYDAKKYKHLTMSSGSYAYKVICRKAGLSEEYNDNAVYEHYDGGYFSKPEKELVTGNIYALDFACLKKDTQLITPKGIKQIKNIHTRDNVLGVNGFEKILFINKKKVKKLYKITLADGKTIFSTGEHRFPVNSIHNDKQTKNLKVGDELIIK